MKLQTVKRIYKELNARNFGGVLQMPIIRWNKHRRHAAKYNGQTIYFARDLKLNEMRETVYHEMCHQYIDEFLAIEISDDHGKEFKKQYTKFLTCDIEKDSDYAI